MNTPVYRDGKVHVLAEKCATCIFRPGNLMDLQPGRVKGMVDDCLAEDGGNIPCHSTIYEEEVQPAICRGFWDSYHEKVPLLQVAARMGVVVEDPVPLKEA